MSTAELELLLNRIISSESRGKCTPKRVTISHMHAVIETGRNDDPADDSDDDYHEAEELEIQPEENKLRNDDDSTIHSEIFYDALAELPSFPRFYELFFTAGEQDKPQKRKLAEIVTQMERNPRLYNLYTKNLMQYLSSEEKLVVQKQLEAEKMKQRYLTKKDIEALTTQSLKWYVENEVGESKLESLSLMLFRWFLKNEPKPTESLQTLYVNNSTNQNENLSMSYDFEHAGVRKADSFIMDIFGWFNKTKRMTLDDDNTSSCSIGRNFKHFNRNNSNENLVITDSYNLFY